MREKIDVDPTCVVRGKQVNNTINWLRKMFLAAHSRIDTTSEVKLILSLNERREVEKTINEAKSFQNDKS